MMSSPSFRSSPNFFFAILVVAFFLSWSSHHADSFSSALVSASNDAILTPKNNGGAIRSSSSSNLPNLPFGDINVVILTDVHSWLASHRRHEPYNDADFGDILSFWERLKERCETEDLNTKSPTATSDPTDTDTPPPQQCGDLFFVNNGDFIDGTGLTRKISGEDDSSYLIPLLEKMPYDAVNVGNHELYSSANIEYMTRPGGYVDWWGDRYLTSNIHFQRKDNTARVGHRYKILKGRDTNILVFGFLYNMNNAASNVEIQKVESVVKQEWFLVDALSEEQYDAILVLAHMDLVDKLVAVIQKAIRDQIGDDTPVVFVTGHTHYRGHKMLDNQTMTFEAGRYLDTVGFVSFPTKESALLHKSDDDASSLYQHVYLDTNRNVLLTKTLGFASPDDAETTNGRALSEFIDVTRKQLGLEEEVGCAPQNYKANHGFDKPDSLWGLYRNEVVPKVFSSTRKSLFTIQQQQEEEGGGGASTAAATEEEEEDDLLLPMAMLLSKESWRYDIFSTASLIVDDIFAVAPFNDTVVYLGSFSADVITKANRTLNGGSHDQNDDRMWFSPALPEYILIMNSGDASSDSLTTTTTTTNPSFSGSSGSSVKSVSGAADAEDTKYHVYTHDFGAEKIQRVLEKINPSSEKVTIQKTEITSTMIWTAFIKEYWSCDDVGGSGVSGGLRGSTATPRLGSEMS